jgi:hypothetical protein
MNQNRDDHGKSVDEAAEGLTRAPLIKRFGFLFLAVAVSTSLFYTNCDGGFKYDPNSGQLSSLGGDGTQPSGDLKVTTFSPAGMVVPEGQSFEGGVEYRLVATATGIETASLAWQLTENTGNCVMRNGSGPETRYLQCDRSGRVSVQTSATFSDGRQAVASVPRTTADLIADSCGASTADRVVFRIPAATGSSPWNSSSSPVLAFVGQTVRICNNDSRGHRLHTGGNPCPHQNNTMMNGQFYDCSIRSTAGANATTGIVGGTYNHDVGDNAVFYIRVLSGQALYADATQSTTAQSCASCHNGLTNSTKRTRTFAQIKAAIAAVPEMAGYRTLLTDDEIRAIAYALR